MEQLLTWDTDLLLWINSHHCTVLDWVMWTASQVWSWAAVVLLIFGLLTLRREPRRWWIAVLAVILCFLLADRISVMAFKDVFHRLRPCHVIDNLHMFRTGCGGQYGFVSSHAANIFAIVTFFIMRYSVSGVAHRCPSCGHSDHPHVKNKFMHSKLAPILLLLWAIVVCYSRPYLGKHYPGDVLCGAMLGILIGLLVWWLAKLLEKKVTK